MKFLKRYGISCLALALALVLCFQTVSSGVLCLKETQKDRPIRTVALSDSAVDYQAVLDGFERSELNQEGTLTTFTGYQSLDPSLFEEFDNLSDTDVDTLADTEVLYTFSYDVESNVVTLSASAENELGEIEIDTVSGVGFYNDAGEIDAVMNIEGEGILLSEMRACGAIANCGWFSKLIKKVAKDVATTALVVAAAAACVAVCATVAPAVVAVGLGVSATTAIAACTVIAETTLTVAMIAAGVLIAAEVVDLTFQGVKYRLEEFSKMSSKLKKGKYYLCVGTSDGGMLITPVALKSLSDAAAAYNMGLSIYSILADDAEAVATRAGNGNDAVHDKRHKPLYFNHYHRFDRTPKNAHSFYGFPVP